MTTCAVCVLPISAEDDDASHFPHDTGCPNADGLTNCTCANQVHADCCPCMNGGAETI